ncbi:MAG: acetyl-CoA carboxylase carboxyltransferase subunit alpha [Holosporaceae bacterium]|jgi:acetyl-CoA carboxylase carboxyl transferase subunit alpha|nr:acetyl-CoA carboxylase carboxyltransferase subunit alpha [Holosporaceae bacterium]
MTILDFEKPIFELDAKINELKDLNTGNLGILEDIKRIEGKQKKLLKKIYDNLGPWEKVMVARHPDRPKTSDYIEVLIQDFVPLAGDRLYGNDLAITAGIGKFAGMSVAVIGHEKGKDTEGRIEHNFGMPHPEGYRKACRVMDIADRFGLPLLTFIDTAGAYPGVGAEERGQAEAIAKCLERSLKFRGAIVATIIGEGGSGGAVALATANVIFMLKYSVYSVISPEGCASILYRDAEKSREAAEALKLTADDLKNFRVIDHVIDEPLGGAHRDPVAVIRAVGERIKSALLSLANISDLKAHRNDKFLNLCSNGLADIGQG